MATPGNESCEIRLGSVLVSLLDPTPGEEVAFHRWYERDHFYAGCLLGAWFFAGRRFVATRALKDLRFPASSPVIDDVSKGSYLALYWILDGHHQEAQDFAVRRVNDLIEHDRMLPSRRQAHAGFYLTRFSARREPDGVPPELALDHPFPGCALVMLDRNPDVDPEAFLRWRREEQVPGVLRDSPAALCVALDPVPLPDDAPAYVARPPGLERRSLHLYFLDEDPRAGWQEHFASQADAVRASGLGVVSYAAPFIPTVPGSDRHADELW